MNECALDQASSATRRAEKGNSKRFSETRNPKKGKASHETFQ